MRVLLFVVMCIFPLLCYSCQSPSLNRVYEAPQHFTAQAARRQAREDFAAGRPVVFVAGSVGTYEPGITEAQKPVVAGLPRNCSLAGCTNPLVVHSDRFATAYNREVILLLQAKPQP